MKTEPNTAARYVELAQRYPVQMAELMQARSEYITLETNYDGTVVYEDGASGHLVSTFTGV